MFFVNIYFMFATAFSTAFFCSVICACHLMHYGCVIFHFFCVKGSMDVARPLCRFCGAVDRPLQYLAHGGDLHIVCQVCFLCQEISHLTARLTPESEILSLVVEELDDLYQAVQADDASRRDAAESQRRSQGQGKGRGRGKGCRQGLRKGQGQGRGKGA